MEQMTTVIILTKAIQIVYLISKRLKYQALFYWSNRWGCGLSDNGFLKVWRWFLFLKKYMKLCLFTREFPNYNVINPYEWSYNNMQIFPNFSINI